MPLTSAEDYDSLGAHLDAIDPVLTAWAAAHGLERDFNCGRYPRRVYRRDGQVGAFLDIEMEVDSSGQRFGHFFPAVPYWAVFGVYQDASRADMPGRRIVLFRDLPFARLLSELPRHLRICEALLSKYTSDYLHQSNETFMMPLLEL